MRVDKRRELYLFVGLKPGKGLYVLEASLAYSDNRNFERACHLLSLNSDEKPVLVEHPDTGRNSTPPRLAVRPKAMHYRGGVGVAVSLTCSSGPARSEFRS